MKTLLCLLLRATFLLFYGLSMFKSKMLLADTRTVDLPQIGISELNFTVKAPAGWKVRQHYRGKTLVFEDPLVSSHDNVEYSRNITVAVKQEVRPVDALEAQHLTQKLVQELGDSVTDFEVNESRIIDYRFKGDAILVFTSFRQNHVPMRQMHVFTSGSKDSVLLTYTDLKESFEAEGTMDQVWESMMSAELSGEAPHRYDGVFYALSGLAFLVTAAFLSKQLRRREMKMTLRSEDAKLFDDDDEFEIVKHAVPEKGRGSYDWQVAETRFAGQTA